MIVASDNLMPASRRHARAARLRMRGWIAGWVMMLGVGAVGIATALGARHQGPRASVAEWTALEERSSASQARLTLLKAEAARLMDRKATLELIGTHPNWSVVLALLSHRLGPTVSLSSVEILPAKLQPTARAAYSVAIAGSAVDQSAVASFVLSLERLGVFDTVSLRQSRREGLGENAPVGFEVVCVIEEGR